MYSQCPECHARFRVTAKALRAAGGTVRCGRCGGAFNALTWLSDTLPPSLGDGRNELEAVDMIEAGFSGGPVTVTEFHFTADDIEKVFVDSLDWQQAVTGAAAHEDGEDVPGTGAEPPIVVESENRPFEDITLEGDDTSIESLLDHESEKDSTDEFAVLRDVPDSAYPEGEPEAAVPEETLNAPDGHEPSIEERRPETSVLDILLEVGPHNRSRPETTLQATPTEDEPGLAEELRPWEAMRPRRATDAPYAESLHGHAERRPGRSALAWSLASLLLALALLAQLVHQYRQELVRHPQVGPLLEKAYARLGMPLSPNWDLDAFELRQWGTPAGDDANGHLTVRASIRNRASFAQPHPILRLELDDRYGDAVAVRDFEPAEYLKNPSEASRQIAPDSSTEAELEIIEPSPEAVGYQLDVCLRESPSLLRCAGKRG